MVYRLKTLKILMLIFQKLAIYKENLVLWYIFTIRFQKHGSSALSIKLYKGFI